MKRLITLGACATLLLATGCASVGNASLGAESEQSIHTKITEGKTTKAELRGMFGSPIKTSFTDSGQEIWNYEFSKMSADMVSFIPGVSMLGSSASGTKKELVVLFDREGIVRRFSMSESQVNQKTGVFTQ